MKKLSVSEFKAKVLGVMNQVARTGETIVVTKRGKAIVKVIPFVEEAAPLAPGKLRGTVVEEGDIVAPLGADLWNAAR